MASNFFCIILAISGSSDNMHQNLILLKNLYQKITRLMF